MHCVVLSADSVVLERTLLTGWVQICSIDGLIDFLDLQTEPIKHLGDYELFETFEITDEGIITAISSHHSIQSDL